MKTHEFERKIDAAQQRLYDLLQHVEQADVNERTWIKAAVEELSTSLEELHVAQEELRQQNEALVAVREQLAAERRRYQDLFAFAPDGYLVTDAEGLIQEANRAAAALLAVRQEFLVGKPLAVFVAKEARADFYAQISRFQAGEVSSRMPWETRICSRHGDLFPAAVTIAPIWNGELIGLRWLIRDITARKQAEEALTRYADALQRSNEDLQQFAYVVSHDLKAPLRMVKSFVRLLQEALQDELDAKTGEYIHFAVDGAAQMETLIDALLDYARVDTQGQDPVPTDAEEILGQVLRTLAFDIEGHDAEVTHDPLPTVLADPTQLVQLFQNLVGNALKFSGDDPPCVHVTAAKSPASMEESLGQDVTSDIWRFAVRDNGIGIAPKDQERIFGIFQRLHTREAYEGTGIGLAVCKKIVERHGGRIWVESEAGQGATFYFTLPGVG